jgi:MoaA/NifB/PqqE/SkfB family radical SAM enzyme
MLKQLKVLSSWSLNRLQGKRRPLVATFALTSYCNFYCPMCPFGDPDKEAQLMHAMQRDLSTEQWKYVMSKVAKYAIWSIVEGGEPTSRKDIMELLRHLHSIGLPFTLITNGSLLHKINLEELASYGVVCCSIDSVREDSYCKIRGVSPSMYKRVMENVRMLSKYNVKRAINTVITKYNYEEFITHEYFDFVRKELDIHVVNFTFVEDVFASKYTLAPSREVKSKVARAIIDYAKKHDDPFVATPFKYMRDMIEYGRAMYDSCATWKVLFVQSDGSVIVPCYRFDSEENRMSILKHSIDEIYEHKAWDIAENCNECDNMACVWYLAQNPLSLADSYIRGLVSLIKYFVLTSKDKILSRASNTAISYS